MVLEVNTNPSWRGLQSVADIDIAEAIAEDFLDRRCAPCAEHRRADVPPARAARSAELFLAACRAELDALKPGNVHVHAGGHGMEVAQFEAAPPAAAPSDRRSRR